MSEFQTDDRPARRYDSANAAGDSKSERLKLILEELSRPLDDDRWSKTSDKNEVRGDTGFRDRLRQTREQRRDLKAARRAAAAAFGTKAPVSARKQASLLMGAGALGVAAFTAPPLKPSQNPFALETNRLEGSRMPAALIEPSDEFKQALIEEEGVRYTVYRDVAGYPTVGVGHLVVPQDDLRVGDRIGEDRVLAFLSRDLEIAADAVRDLVGDLPLFQHEFDALLDLVYNVGAGTVGEHRSPRLNDAIENGDYSAIADELRYTEARGRYARGLHHRSERREQMFLDASYDDPREIASSSAA